MNGCQIINLYNILGLKQPLNFNLYGRVNSSIPEEISSSEWRDRIYKSEKRISEMADYQKYNEWPPKHVITITVGIKHWKK